MKKQSLDVDNREFREILSKSSELILDFHANIDTQQGYHNFPQGEVEHWFDEPLPEDGTDYSTVMDQVKTRVMDIATGNAGHNMYAYVMAGGTQISIVAEQIAAALNQNQAKWHLGPSVNEIEKRVIAWGAQMIGLAPGMGGILVSGGSAANLAGLTVARNILFEKQKIRERGLFSAKPMTVYASREVHGCVDKSMELLGLGTDQLRKIDTNPDFTISIDALKKQITQDRNEGFQPVCIIGNAGTVNTGAIDDLQALASLTQDEGLWFHVDGAYGSLAATLPELESKYAGMDRAHSVAVDFHKWLYQPFEAGCVFIKDWQTMKQAYFKVADYLDTSLEVEAGRLDFNEHYFQLSRNAKSLKVWMSLKVYGMKRFRDMIRKDIALAHYLADTVANAPDFELMSRSELAICCFRYTGNLAQEADISAINQRLIPALEKDGRVFITGTRLHGQYAIRACVINHRKQEKDIDYLVDVVRDVARNL